MTYKLNVIKVDQLTSKRDANGIMRNGIVWQSYTFYATDEELKQKLDKICLGYNMARTRVLVNGAEVKIRP